MHENKRKPPLFTSAAPSGLYHNAVLGPTAAFRRLDSPHLMVNRKQDEVSIMTQKEEQTSAAHHDQSEPGGPSMLLLLLLLLQKVITFTLLLYYLLG